MKKVLVGYLIDGKKGGIDKFLLNMLDVVDTTEYQVDFLSNKDTPELREHLSKYNSNLHVVATLKHPLKQYRQMCDLIKKESYDVVYFNISEAFHTIGLLAAWVCKVPKRIVHSHSSGCDAEGIAKKVRTLLHSIAKKTMIHAANVFVTCSDKAANWMYPKAICKKGNLITILNGVDQERFEFSEEKRAQVRKDLGWDNKKILFHVGNLTYVKNHDFLLNLTKRLTAKDESFQLILVGNGDLKEQIENRIEELQIGDYVQMLGLRSDVNELLQGSDYFLLPSFFEGFPISSMEAQISGNLCLLSDAITRDCKITDQCLFLDINDLGAWEQAILENVDYQHRPFKNITDKTVDVKKQGYIFDDLFA